LEILDTGELPALRLIIQKTPPGIIEMLQIKGIGPKKISTIWKEMEIESIGELLYACNENRLLLYKGFGEKTQKNISETIEFYLKSQGSFLYAEIEKLALNLEEQLRQKFPQAKTNLTGAFRQQQVVIHQLELVTTISASNLKAFMEEGLQMKEIDKGDAVITYKGKENIALKFFFASDENFYSRLFETSSQPEFLEAWKKQHPAPEPEFTHEQAIFDAAKIPFIPAWLRESDNILQKEHHDKINHVIQPSDIKGVIHNHSNWSDGLKTIEEMAKACIEKGYEYLVISDHSKTAFYANGLSEERVAQQHLYIDELNKKLAPFRIYKSIESDILNDGSLDYDEMYWRASTW
jgi:DNA polymerase (family 10)